MSNQIMMKKIIAMFMIVTYCNYYVKCQSNSTSVSANTDIGPCTCDLTANACDVDCCCDTTDCTDNDRLAFSKCIDRYTFPEKSSCYPKTLIFTANTANIVASSGSSVLCINQDNFVARNYYTVPNTMTTIYQIGNATLNYLYSYFTITSYARSAPETYKDYYASGDPLYVFYSTQSLGLLGFPVQLDSGLCTDSNPTSFLVNTASSCGRVLQGDLCTPGSIFSADLYTTGFKLVSSPSIFKNQLLGLANDSAVVYNTTGLLSPIVTVVCVTVSGEPVSCSSNTTIEFNSASNICSNLVKKVDYQFTYKGTSGITDFQIKITLQQQISPSTSPMVQYFSSNFVQSSATTSKVRGGNPGYLYNRALLAGLLINGAIAQLADGITVPTAATGARGLCSANVNRRTVTFGQNMQLSCVIPISSTLASQCSVMQANILSILRRNDTNVYIASWGNAQLTLPGDWTPLLEENCDASPAAQSPYTCSSIITGQNLQIVYARVGALVNPQNKILGVRRQCVRGDLKYQCVGASCNPSSAIQQHALISTAVAFIDKSQPALAAYQSRPIFLARLPRDFFYPFWVEAGASQLLNNTMACRWLTFVLSTIMWIWRL